MFTLIIYGLLMFFVTLYYVKDTAWNNLTSVFLCVCLNDECILCVSLRPLYEISIYQAHLYKIQLMLVNSNLNVKIYLMANFTVAVRIIFCCVLFDI